MKTIWNWLSQEKTVLSAAGIVFVISLMSLFSLQLDTLYIVFMTSGFLVAILLYRLVLRNAQVTSFRHPWKWYTLGVILFVSGTVAGLLFQTPLSRVVLIGVRLVCAVIAAIGITMVFYTLKGASESWKNGAIALMFGLGWVLYYVLGHQYPYDSPWYSIFASMRLVYLVPAVFFILCLFAIQSERKSNKKSEGTDKGMKT